jgi:hypothetical protein
VELNVANNQLAYLPFELLQLIGPDKSLTKLQVLPNPFMSAGIDFRGYCIDAGRNFHVPNTVGEFLELLDKTLPSMIDDTDDKTNSPAWWLRRLMEELWILLREDGGRTTKSREEDIFLDCKSLLYPLRPLFIASSEVRLFRTDGSPMDKDMPKFAPDEVIPGTLDLKPKAQPPKPPSLLELAVKACSAYPDISSIEAMVQDGPPPVARAISHIEPARIEGGRICSICQRDYIIPRAQWIEYWHCIPANPKLINEDELCYPFLRRGCSHFCTDPTQRLTSQICLYDVNV